MLQALLMSALLMTQDPKAASRTVEERLKELDERLTTLEAKEKRLKDENAAMDKQLSDAKAMREKIARQTGAAWVKQYAKPVGFSEAQSTELEELWVGWTKEDMEKGADPARWKAREETLRSKLSGDQAPRLARRIREEREEQARRSVTMFTQTAKLSAEKTKALGDGVVRRMSVDEGLLLPQAHPQDLGKSWGQTVSALEESVSDPAVGLSEEERQTVLKSIAPWKPKSR